MSARFPTPTSIAIVLASLLAACNSSGGGADPAGDSNSDNNSNGSSTPSEQIHPLTSQKGPFSTGSLVEIVRITEDGLPGDDRVTTTTEADGSFDAGTLPWDGPTMVTVTGPYFDEVQGGFTSDELALRAFPKSVEGVIDTNVNLITHIMARYVEYWMTEGYGYDSLVNNYALEYVGAFFGIAQPPGELNILDSINPAVDRDSRTLLLLSAGFSKAGLDQAALDRIADDFAESDGEVTGDGIDDLNAWLDAVTEDPDALFTQAHNALMQQYNRAGNGLPTEAKYVYSLGTICNVSENLLCGRTSEQLDVSIPEDGITLNVITATSGNYAFGVESESGLGWRVIRYSDDDQIFPFLTGNYYSGSIQGYYQSVTPFLEGGTRYLLEIENRSSETKVASVWMNQDSEGSKQFPEWIYTGSDTFGRAGISSGTIETQTSFYRLAGQAGRYRLTLERQNCDPDKGFEVRILNWVPDDSGTSETRNGFDQGSVVASSSGFDEVYACEQTFEFTKGNSHTSWLSVKNTRLSLINNAPGHDGYTLTLTLLFAL